MVSRRCRDCEAEGITSRRKAPYPGPRCTTHNRQRRSERRSTDHARRLQAVYNLKLSEYEEILAHQGGKCAICQRATGKSRRLSVDHKHEKDGGGYIRGLLCGPCNRDVLGHLRDNVEALQRAIDYLTNPPAVEVIGVRYVPFDEEL
ncbi:endonuclease VII [Gordonia phage Yvonnetastic]|uniref:Endonuclease VII n=1 Tax=Gordonia phage Yvonnetastic TaxID=1821566 RepID=A0A142K9A2_9CAUD|nr:endonuclease VII [Gordonia phage Yvonnetastic]AMS02685.1 endonuclease VII [Gordonia phage Yvonnetastic]WKW86118.1 endonuclease VII [Gordonia Phage JonJames]